MLGIMRKFLSPAKTAELCDRLRRHGDLRVACQEADLEPARVEAILAGDEGVSAGLVRMRRCVERAAAEGAGNRPALAKALFVAELRARGNVSQSVGAQPWYTREWFYKERDRDKDFASAWKWAIEDACDALEAEAWRRGVEGVNDPVVYQGKFTNITDPHTGETVGVLSVRRYSDRMLELLLKANRPEKFGDRARLQHEVKGAGVLVVPAAVSPSEWERMAESARQAATGVPGDEA
jgi:hypothetical protein